MCGKFTQLARQEMAFFHLLSVIPTDAPATVSTPMRITGVWRLGEDGKPERVLMRWGFSKPENPSFKPDNMHARAETIDRKPTFADSFAERRGIILVETFNEGEEQPNGKNKQWVIQRKDRELIAIAVIWEKWEGENSAEATFVMVTVPANELIGRVTDRMPAVLRHEDWPMWLGETDASLTDVKALLKTFDDEGAWEMSEQASPKSSKSAKTKPQLDLL